MAANSRRYRKGTRLASLPLAGLLFFTLVCGLYYRSLPGAAQASGHGAIAGRLLDSQGQPVRGAEVKAYISQEEEPAAAE